MKGEKMAKYFEIKWYKTKDGVNFTRTNAVIVPNAPADTGAAAKRALENFIVAFGNLKKNTIIEIQEYDKEGQPVGEPIIPGDDYIIPEKKK